MVSFLLQLVIPLIFLVSSYAVEFTLSGELNLLETERVLTTDDAVAEYFGYNKTELCQKADEATRSQCYIEGNYCYFGSTTRNVTFTTSTLLGEQSNIIQCYNASAVSYKICPSGYYCPENTTLTNCPRGYFCYAGSIGKYI